jgi:hypothetical protein
MPHLSALHQALIQPLLHLRASVAQLNPEAIARQSGFLRRSPRKIAIVDLVLGCCALASESFLSLERIASVIGLAAHCTYAKQSFHQRLAQGVQPFLAQLALALFSKMSDPLRRTGYFAPFGRVMVHDSTIQSLPRSLAPFFPGSCDQKSKTRAALRIQWVCDLLAGSLLQLTVCGYRRNDQAAAGDILSIVKKGDLILRDLGYFSLQVLAQLIAQGAFFLTRLRNGVILRDPESGREIDLLLHLRREGRFDGPVLVGRERILMRLVVLPVPEEVANLRRARARSDRDRRSTPSRKRLALMDWSMFVTNVGQETWPAEVVAKIYRLRWRVEIIFKSWKSHLRLRELNCRSADLVRLSVMLKLLYCLLTFRCFENTKTRTPPHQDVSLLRFAKVLGHCGPLITAIILGITPAQLLEHYLAKHIFYERRPDRQNFPQQLAALVKGLA